MDIISFNESSTANSRIEKFIENPDSTSGIITTPKTIASGETVTIPSGRVAVLPNTIVEGNVVVEAGGEIFVPAGSTYGNRVMYEKINYIATQGQTVFSVNYDLGSVDVYVNGIRLANADFTATTLTSVTLASGLNAGDIVELVSFGAFTVADTYTKAETDNALSLKVALADFTGANASLTGNGYQKLPSGLIIQWGQTVVTSGAETTVTLPISYPSLGVLNIFATRNVLGSATTAIEVHAYYLSSSQIKIGYFITGGGNANIMWMTIGY